MQTEYYLSFKGDVPKNITICGYKKMDVLNEYENSIIDNKIETACRWACELHTSGYLEDMWFRIFIIISKNINISNPRLPAYILENYRKYILICSENKNNRTFLNNNQELRNIIANITCICCQSDKNTTLHTKILPNLGKANLTKAVFSKKIISTDVNIKTILKDDEYPEIKLAINEINTHIKLHSNISKIYYWIRWLDLVDKNKLKNKQSFESKSISFDEIPKYKNDWIWIIWSMIIDNAKELNNDQLEQILNLYSIFKINYKKSTKLKRLALMYHAILIMQNNLDWSTKICNNYTIWIQTCCNINIIYKSIKENVYTCNNGSIIGNIICEKLIDTISMPARSIINPHNGKTDNIQTEIINNAKKQDEYIYSNNINITNRYNCNNHDNTNNISNSNNANNKNLNETKNSKKNKNNVDKISENEISKNKYMNKKMDFLMKSVFYKND